MCLAREMRAALGPAHRLPFREPFGDDLVSTKPLAISAERALAMLEGDDHGYDVVFSDVVMPGMDGVALAEELRRRRPDLPIVLTSGYSQVLAQIGRHGFELLHKPYSLEQLARVLGKAIGWQRCGRIMAGGDTADEAK